MGRFSKVLYFSVSYGIWGSSPAASAFSFLASTAEAAAAKV